MPACCASSFKASLDRADVAKLSNTVAIGLGFSLSYHLILYLRC